MTSAWPGPARQGRVLVIACAILALTTLAGCASRASRAAGDRWPARLVAAGEQDAEGCYRCLSAALETYEALLAVRPDAAVGARAYRTAVHLAIRERLIGLYPGVYQAAPARLAPGAAPGDVDLASDVLAAIPWRRGVLPLEHVGRP